jgi:tetratricopeptide (TPR) repeat protein
VFSDKLNVNLSLNHFNFYVEVPMPYSQFPDTPSYHVQATLSQQIEIAWGYIDSQNIQKALSACKQINAQYSDSAEGWFATSFLAFQLRNVSQALIAIDKAIQLEPHQPKWKAHQAHTYLLAGDKSTALKIISSLIESLDSKIQDAHLCAEMALMLNKLGQYKTAIDFYQQAIALAPSSGELYFNLASVQRYLGKNHEAEVNLNWAISLNPNDYEAYLQRASLRKQSIEDNHTEQLKSLIAKGITHPVGKAQVCYALAKELEDLKEYSKSFEYLTQGANSRRKNMQYDLNNDLLGLEKIAAVFDKSFIDETHTANHNKMKPNQNDQAIFILGLPRTGSTLIERIISSHSKVNSAGELNDFALQMMAQVKTLSSKPPTSRSALIELTRHLDFNALGDAYMERTKEHGLSGHKFIDKLPLNSLYVGLIHAALPKAKIIHVKRNPLDTIYAMYKQLFTSGYPFSYDLTELTTYYIAHHKLMMHWQKLLPNIIHQVNYEDVVNNIGNEAKRLINYCQLEWQDQCVDFHQNKAPSTTASASQVREKIYKSSTGKWRHYEKQLDSIKQQLESAGIRVS